MDDATADVVAVVRRQQAAQYNGQNAAAIAALLGDVEIVAEGEDSFTYAIRGLGQEVPLGHWVVWQHERTYEAPVVSVQYVLSPEEYAALYRPAP